MPEKTHKEIAAEIVHGQHPSKWAIDHPNYQQKQIIEALNQAEARGRASAMLVARCAPPPRDSAPQNIKVQLPGPIL